MSKITLRILIVEGGYIIADRKHPVYGGFDVENCALFSHLVPEGTCEELFLDQVKFLAESHGWNVTVSREF